MTHAVIQPQRAGHLLIAAAFACAGCSGLLGLDDKSFGGSGGSGTTTSTPTNSSTGGAGGVSMGGGGTGGGIAGGGTGGVTSTGGMGGALCDPGPDPTRLTDEFEFEPCEPDAATALKARGFHLAWQEEGYSVPPIGLNISKGTLQITMSKSAYWYDGKQAPYIEKLLSGSFMIISDVVISAGDGTAPPTNIAQLGAGLLVRDPASASNPFLERWISMDRGLNYGMQNVHGSWSDGNGGADQGSTALAGSAYGRVALCRGTDNHFHIWSEIAGQWVEQLDMLGALATMGLPDQVQVGVFIYAYIDPPGSDIPGGIRGSFDYIRQYDLVTGSCDPNDY